MIGAMSTTATIRVPVETRDSLQQLAEQKGISVSRLLTLYASREHLNAIYAAERTAVEQDLENPEALTEYELWDDAATNDFE